MKLTIDIPTIIGDQGCHNMLKRIVGDQEGKYFCGLIKEIATINLYLAAVCYTSNLRNYDRLFNKIVSDSISTITSRNTNVTKIANAVAAIMWLNGYYTDKGATKLNSIEKLRIIFTEMPRERRVQILKAYSKAAYEYLFELQMLHLEIELLGKK